MTVSEASTTLAHQRTSDSLAVIGPLLAQTAERIPEKEALVFGDERITWGQLDQRVNNLACAFLEMGVQIGDRVGIFCSTRPEYIYAYLAAVRIGATVVGFNIQYTPREVGELAAQTNPVVMVVLNRKGSLRHVQPILERVPSIRHVIVAGDASPAGFPRLEELIHGERPELADALGERAASVTADTGALIVFTGGTTGLPKGALLTHGNIVSNIRAQVRHLQFRSDDRIMLHLPLNHVSGATLLTIAAVMTGATLVMLERFHPIDTLKTVVREKITIFGQVPTMFIMEFQLPDFQEYDLSCVRMVIVAGAPTPPEIMRRLAAMAPVAIHGYGLTEASGMVTYTDLGDGVDVLLRSAGKISPDFQLRVVDEARQPLPPGSVGEIALRGPCVMAGYYNQRAETDLVLDEAGWLYTGDLGAVDDAGYLTVVGRKKDMLITGGFNVYPLEIEQYVTTHPQISMAACIGVPDPVMGEVGELFVVPKPGAAVTAQEIRRFCKQGLAKYKIPRYVQILPALPMTSLGKVDKMQLRMESAVLNQKD